MYFLSQSKSQTPPRLAGYGTFGAQTTTFPSWNGDLVTSAMIYIYGVLDTVGFSSEGGAPWGACIVRTFSAPYILSSLIRFQIHVSTRCFSSESDSSEALSKASMNSLFGCRNFLETRSGVSSSYSAGAFFFSASGGAPWGAVSV